MYTEWADAEWPSQRVKEKLDIKNLKVEFKILMVKEREGECMLSSSFSCLP